MKLGIGFHVFSGLDLLKSAILNVREFADYIAIIYSEVSYNGHPAAPYMMDLLRDLKKEGLVDELVLYTPNISKVFEECMKNHRAKRKLGQNICLDRGCTHFMSRDCDEFYNKDQFKNALSYFSTHKVLVAPTLDYLDKPTKQAGHSRLHVTVAHDIKLPYQLTCYGVLIDEGRTVETERCNIKVFPKEDLVMHHMLGVRVNQREHERKIEGHSHYTRVGINEYMNLVNNYPNRSFTDVPDQFNILSYWNGEFKKYT